MWHGASFPFIHSLIHWSINHKLMPPAELTNPEKSLSDFFVRWSGPSPTNFSCTYPLYFVFIFFFKKKNEFICSFRGLSFKVFFLRDGWGQLGLISNLSTHHPFQITKWRVFYRLLNGLSLKWLAMFNSLRKIVK